LPVMSDMTSQMLAPAPAMTKNSVRTQWDVIRWPVV
jgi:hypothetical protein